eukprot:2150861-Prorocentrum_lima.AAC.1
MVGTQPSVSTPLPTQTSASQASPTPCLYDGTDRSPSIPAAQHSPMGIPQLLSPASQATPTSQQNSSRAEDRERSPRGNADI